MIRPHIQVAQATDGGYYWRVADPDGQEMASGYADSRESAVADAEAWIAGFQK